jgi:hypothetical protein
MGQTYLHHRFADGSIFEKFPVEALVFYPYRF